MPYVAGRTAPDLRTPQLTTTVPREYVHRAAVSEVFLTGWRADPVGAPDPSFTVTAQWPRSHALFAREGGYQDPMLLLESVRQTGSLLAHAEFGVPFGHQFVMSDLTAHAEPALLVSGPTPTEPELRTVCRDITRRDGRLTAMRYDVTVLRDGVPLGTATAAFRCMSPAVYRRVRGERPTLARGATPPAVAPFAVGHTSARHVVLAVPEPAPPAPTRPHLRIQPWAQPRARPVPGARGRWELRVDTAHPTYFDHPVDHVPGMVLLEAARQAAHASTGLPDALVLGVRGAFARYAELDAPCWIEAHPEPAGADGDVRVRVTGTQQRQTVFTADLTVRPRTR
ncbi:ScbA/BarX family gamma-butyrolactone biosynthesis protein [Streptomyces sp. NPDC018347]|uniref:ScbA/BarX family gamma-butyrolactone biosynthesis protein n=1 Tax=Streptomyces sp. NPDC018347 TaxID=3157193 RepID=UPI0033F1F98F